jgi:diacylglycerol kinase (ATP)
MSENNNKWCVIINPNAGIRRGERDWPIIERKLLEFGVEFNSFFTEKQEHAIELTKKLILDGYKKIITVGGDGTFNEVANGILTQNFIDPLQIKLGLITIGTGNDWGRMYKIPFDYDEAIEVILKDNTFIQDVCKVSYTNGIKMYERYFINVAGLGFDAQVALKVNKRKEQGKGGKFSYFLNIFQTLLRYKSKFANIRIDNKSFQSSIFSLNVGLCKYNGGGMKQLPHAIPNDGQLAFTIIRKISKFKVITNAYRLYSGSFIKMPQVDVYKGKHIDITSDKNIYLEVDGESIGHTPIEFKIKPASIRLLTNTDS